MYFFVTFSTRPTTISNINSINERGIFAHKNKRISNTENPQFTTSLQKKFYQIRKIKIQREVLNVKILTPLILGLILTISCKARAEEIIQKDESLNLERCIRDSR